MPRVNWGIPAEQRLIAEDIRREYGNMLTASDVGRLLGYKHAKAYNEWLRDVPAYRMNGERIKYFAMDIAKKLYLSREEVCNAH